MKLTHGMRRSIVKLVVYAVACLAFLFWLITLVGNVHWFRAASSYKAELDDVTGLLANDSVKIAGVEVGKVQAINAHHGHAVVTFSLQRNVHVTSTTRVGVRWRNVIGAKYLYLYPGSGGHRLDPGATLPLDQSLSSADVGDFLNALGPFLRAINPQEVNAFVQAVVAGLQGNEVKVRDLLANAGAVTQTVGSLDTQVGRTIDNLDKVVGALSERDSAVDALVQRLSTLATTLAQRNDTITQLVDDLGPLQGQLSKLLAANRSNIDTSIANLQSITDVLQAHEADVETGIRTLGQGFAPYHFISSYGQWFQIRAVYVCLAQENSCLPELQNLNTVQQSESQPAPVASTPAAASSPAHVPSVADITGFAVNGRAGG